jgi:hypothetical protein
MNLTSISQVRSHLQHLLAGPEGQAGGGVVRDMRIIAPLDGWSNLPHTRLIIDSEKFKAVRTEQPTFDSIVLGDDPVTLPHRDIIPGSTVIAADSSLSVIYEEFLDYTIDYEEGRLSRVQTGSISSGQAIALWIVYYRVYTKGEDYEIDYVRGRWSRHVSGLIEPGQELLVDYRLASAGFSDEEITQAIVESEAEIGRDIDAQFSDSTDPALQSAATFLTLAILCRNAAGASLSSQLSRPDAASHWLTLAGSYRETALRLLRWFRRPSPDKSFPKLA